MTSKGEPVRTDGDFYCQPINTEGNATFIMLHTR